jgi:AbrB family looped-hinge helix DNA binding protein
MNDLPSVPDGRRIREAAVEYIVSRKEDPALTTISSKNQITLPAYLLREMGLGAGDRLAISREGNRLVLRARPKDWVEYYGGSLRGLYGNTKEEEDAYVRGLREDTEREQAIEEAWSGRKPDAES